MPDNLLPNMALTEVEVHDIIKEALWRHLGSVSLTIKEVQKRDIRMTPDEVKAYIKKLNAEDPPDVKSAVAAHLCRLLTTDYEWRREQIAETMEEIRGQERPWVSVCCRGPIRRMDGVKDGDRLTHSCISCGKACEIYNYLRAEIINTKATMLTLLQKDAALLLKGVETLGYIHQIENPPKTVQRTTVYNFGVTPTEGATPTTAEVKTDEEKLRMYLSLRPKDRDRVIQEIANRVFTLEEELAEEKRLAEEERKRMEEFNKSNPKPENPPPETM